MVFNICSSSSSSVVHPSMDRVSRTANVDECDTNLIMTKTAIRTTDNDHWMIPWNFQPRLMTNPERGWLQAPTWVTTTVNSILLTCFWIEGGTRGRGKSTTRSLQFFRYRTWARKEGDKLDVVSDHQTGGRWQWSRLSNEGHPASQDTDAWRYDWRASRHVRLHHEWLDYILKWCNESSVQTCSSRQQVLAGVHHTNGVYTQGRIDRIQRAQPTHPLSNRAILTFDILDPKSQP